MPTPPYADPLRDPELRKENEESSSEGRWLQFLKRNWCLFCKWCMLLRENSPAMNDWVVRHFIQPIFQNPILRNILLFLKSTSARQHFRRRRWWKLQHIIYRECRSRCWTLYTDLHLDFSWKPHRSPLPDGTLCGLA